jgi:predicted PurR-regulated permease PerM
MTPVAVFVVVILGTSVAGIIGAVFAIPTAAAILSVTDYLRQRDVLLRADEEAVAVPEVSPEAKTEEVATSPSA